MKVHAVVEWADGWFPVARGDDPTMEATSAKFRGVPDEVGRDPSESLTSSRRSLRISRSNSRSRSPQGDSISAARRARRAPAWSYMCATLRMLSSPTIVRGGPAVDQGGRVT